MMRYCTGLVGRDVLCTSQNKHHGLEIILLLSVLHIRFKNKHPRLKCPLKVRHGYFIRQLDKSKSGIAPGSFSILPLSVSYYNNLYIFLILF